MPARRKKDWKEIQSKGRIAKKTKWGLIALSLILGLLIFAQGVKFTKSLFSPWQSKNQRNYLWSGDFNINILIKAKQISLLSFSPHNQKITIIDIPDTTYLEVSRGFGKWMISSIYDLGQSQKESGGGQLLKDTVVNLFGLPIDGFLNFSPKYSQSQTTEIVSEIRKNPLTLITMLPDLKTDLTPFELIRLKWGMSKVRFDKIKQINLEKASLLQKEKLADGTEVLTADLVKLDSILSDLIDPTIQSEHKTIAIFNSTEHGGLAQKAARLITNLGGDVIITSNGQKRFAKTQITGEKSRTLQRLRQIFETDDTIELTQQDLVSSRAQINIFLGEDYFDQL